MRLERGGALSCLRASEKIFNLWLYFCLLSYLRRIVFQSDPVALSPRKGDRQRKHTDQFRGLSKGRFVDRKVQNRIAPNPPSTTRQDGSGSTRTLHIRACQSVGATLDLQSTRQTVRLTGHPMYPQPNIIRNTDRIITKRASMSLRCSRALLTQGRKLTTDHLRQHVILSLLNRLPALNMELST